LGNDVLTTFQSPGDQHRDGSKTANPFEESKSRISEYTAQEITSLQSRLEKRLGPEYISSRPGAAGQKVYYLAAEKCIGLANEVFGFNGWSSAIQNIQIDFVGSHLTVKNKFRADADNRLTRIRVPGGLTLGFP
jgi:recombination DNA repair RAD52 pathway protein